MNIRTRLRFFISLFILMISFGFLSAQDKNYELGSIVLLSGKVVEGSINWQPRKSPSEITFMDLDGKISTLTTTDIKSFSLESGFVFLENKEIAEGEFIQFLFDGEISLFKRDVNYYLRNNAGQILPLVRPTTEQLFNNQENTVKTRNLGIISTLTQGSCNPTDKIDFNYFRLSDETLIEILRKYHKCKKLDYTENFYKKSKLRISFILAGGMNFQSNYESKPINPKLNINATQFNSPEIFVGVRLSEIRFVPKKMFVDFLFSYSQRSSEVLSQFEDQTARVLGSHEYKKQSFRAPFTLNYNFLNNSKLNTYAGLGGIFQFHTTDSSFSIVDSQIKSENLSILTERSWNSIRATTLSPSFKLGFNYKIKEKSNVFTELIISHVYESESIDFTNRKGTYNQLLTQLLVGFSF
ncbi:hypothetical protein SAMN06295967_11263 [Belliella buryatensis]|uniref:Outer membrane protein beta-barrel domain-containing protein n=1 Tax=Belliella buryatensis TaxID=1500549 RepID=A0A239FDH6_9BACT|nr:hypothetical protein [Belliella buryatensis]SNS54976.1 hypothetical protein SAMN06295967_11263 [Belliella buryatensis]